MLNLIRKDNPTASKFLESRFSKGKPSGIKPTSGIDIHRLKILCTNDSCTVFGEGNTIERKVLMEDDSRSGKYVCPICNKSVSYDRLRMNLAIELPEYIYNDETTTKDIKDINEEREVNERLFVRPINAESPFTKNKKSAVRVVK